MKTGSADLPLHSGRAPKWLFKRMKELAREISLFIISEMGQEKFFKKLSDPNWFQAFGCVLGFDWHSSGLTTTVCGALKEGLKGLESESGVYVAGGKGRASRNTPNEIDEAGKYISVDPQDLVYASRMSAKVDSSAVQDGYQIYHHSFLFTESGLWTVIQQGMNEDDDYARRYHWVSSDVLDFVDEPQTAICCDDRGTTLNLVAQDSDTHREVSSNVASEKPIFLLQELKKMKRLSLPERHSVLIEDINPTRRLNKAFEKTYERDPDNFEELLSIKGVGAKTIRALSLISELVYGEEANYEDPAEFSFAHGGKDGTPYPVNTERYDRSIRILKKAVDKSRLNDNKKCKAIKRLQKANFLK